MTTAGCQHRLRREQLLPCPLDKAFAFFSQAENLEAITPPFLHFRIASPAAAIEEGAVIDYRLRMFGFPMRWRSRIDEFQPPRRFIDVQVIGPYKTWRHVHEFQAAGDETLMTDTIDYAVGWGPAGSLAHSLFVRRTLARIFDYRRRQIDRLLRPEGAARGAD
jgi:ligand-binding SRPBCC domain-containing protein